MQAGFVSVAYALGTEFNPALRMPTESVLRWDR
jgi:hypothetical protein